MEPIMIILLLLGALIIGGHALDRNPPRAGSDAVTPATPTEGAAEVRQVCDAQDLRQRDLTIPYISRTPPALPDAKACDD
jgi:hypothetical protein